MREIKAGEYYRHFKGGQYQVTAIARDANTEEKVVVYQALYGEEEFWVRPYEEFASEVDREKYPDAEQTWRFEKIEEPQQMNPLLLRVPGGQRATGTSWSCFRRGRPMWTSSFWRASRCLWISHWDRVLSGINTGRF